MAINGLNIPARIFVWRILFKRLSLVRDAELCIKWYFWSMHWINVFNYAFKYALNLAFNYAFCALNYALNYALNHALNYAINNVIKLCIELSIELMHWIMHWIMHCKHVAPWSMMITVQHVADWVAPFHRSQHSRPLPLQFFPTPPSPPSLLSFPLLVHENYG